MNHLQYFSMVAVQMHMAGGGGEWWGERGGRWERGTGLSVESKGSLTHTKIQSNLRSEEKAVMWDNMKWSVKIDCTLQSKWLWGRGDLVGIEGREVGPKD